MLKILVDFMEIWKHEQAAEVKMLRKVTDINGLTHTSIKVNSVRNSFGRPSWQKLLITYSK